VVETLDNSFVVEPDPVEDYRPLSLFIESVQKYPWFINVEDVEIIKKLGEGGSGEIYSCLYKGKKCAVKKIVMNDNLMKSNDYNHIISEISILSQVHSKYVVAFYGIYFDHFVNIVMEQLDFDLEKKDSQDKKLTIGIQD